MIWNWRGFEIWNLTVFKIWNLEAKQQHILPSLRFLNLFWLLLPLFVAARPRLLCPPFFNLVWLEALHNQDFHRSIATNDCSREMGRTQSGHRTWGQLSCWGAIAGAAHLQQDATCLCAQTPKFGATCWHRHDLCQTLVMDVISRPAAASEEDRGFCIYTAPQRHCQFTETLRKAGKRTMRVLATTFVLITAQCLPSCAVGGCSHSLCSCQNYSLLFHFKDNKVTSSWLINGALLLPRHLISFVCKL